MRTLFCLLLLGSVAAADRVVLNDGSVLEGTVKKTSAKQLMVDDKKVDLATVWLWEREAVAVYVPSLKHRLRAYRVLADAEQLRRCADLFPKAIASTNRAAALDLLEWAESAGLEPKQSTAWRGQLDKLPDHAKAKEDPEPYARAGHAYTDILLARARAAKAAHKKDETTCLQLVDTILRRDPEHAETNAFLKTFVSKRWRIGDHKTWLQWRLLILPQGARVITRRHPRHMDLDKAISTWEFMAKYLSDERKKEAKEGKKVKPVEAIKLHGFETPEIVLLTPMKEARPLASFLKYGRITCRALERIFYTDNPGREEYTPLVIYFYQDKESYVQLSGGSPGHLGLTLGHFSPGQNISRFYWFKRPGAERTIMEVFVHELTHHWLERRCPRFTWEDMNHNALTRGFWIVEGFPTFMQEGRYDVDKMVWTHFNPHSFTLDVVSTLAAEGKLLDWETVYPLNQAEFAQLSHKFDKPARLRWALHGVRMSDTNLFYQQSAATCQFLYHGEKGKYRKQLADYVAAYYTGKNSKLDSDRAFGLSPNELGEKTVAFADKVMKGWKPKK